MQPVAFYAARLLVLALCVLLAGCSSQYVSTDPLESGYFDMDENFEQELIEVLQGIEGVSNLYGGTRRLNEYSYLSVNVEFYYNVNIIIVSQHNSNRYVYTSAYDSARPRPTAEEIERAIHLTEQAIFAFPGAELCVGTERGLGELPPPCN